MSLTLSPTELDRLSELQTLLLSPLATDDLGGWRSEVHRRLRELFQAQNAVSILPIGGALTSFSEGIGSEWLRAWHDHYHRLDRGPELTRRLGLPGSSAEMAYGKTFYRTELYNDFLAPIRACRPFVMPIDHAESEPCARFIVHRDSRSRPPFGEFEVALARLLVPAMGASVQALAHLAGPGLLARTLDSLEARLLLCDHRGRTLHASRALERTLEADPERERLEAALQALACTTASRSAAWARSFPAVSREVRTVRGIYTLDVTLLGEAAAGAFLLLVTPRFPEPMSDGELRERYALTPREVEVARRLAAGESNQKLAAALEISPHTAKRHTEHVLAKLGVSSRTQVARAISCTAAVDAVVR